MDIAAYLDGVLRLEPDAPALEQGGRWHAWGELAAAVDAIDSALTAAGIGADEGVAILLRNRPQHCAAILAMLISKRCIVVLNPMQPAARVVADLDKLRPLAVIAGSDDWRLAGIRQSVEAIGCCAISLGDLGVDCVAALPGWERLGAGPFHEPFRGVAVQMLTSGTTGPPKRIPLARAAFEKGFENALAYEKGRQPGDPPKLRSGIAVEALPMVHVSGVFGLVGNILAGRRVCLLERFSVEGWRDAVRRHCPKVASLVPTMLRMILDADIPPEDLASLVALRSGTAPLLAEDAEEMMRRYGIPVLGNYGATEFAGGVAGWSYQDHKRHWRDKRDSVGRINPGITARIVDRDNFAELPLGQTGLLEVKGSQVGDGKTWVRTTDLASLDGDGFLYIHGRADNAILRGGFKIMPGDVVAALQAHPAVREASVVGLDDRRLGQVPAAAWTLVPGAEAPTSEELAAWVKERMTAYSVPVAFKLVEALPRTSSLKVSEAEVRALFNPRSG